jgi:hypothetical protein
VQSAGTTVDNCEHDIIGQDTDGVESTSEYHKSTLDGLSGLSAQLR